MAVTHHNPMTPSKRIAIAASLLLSLTTLTSMGAEENLWNLVFSDLPAGQPLKEIPFGINCPGPQRVVTDADNTLVGSAAIGALTTTPLRFTKKTKTNYTPAFTLKADAPYNSGIITTEFDLILTDITVDAAAPVETLLSVPFMNDKGGSDYVLVVVSHGDSELSISLAGAKKSGTFKAGEVAHVKTVLDLSQHTFQAFLNGAPLTDLLQDETKYSTFLGLTIRDGTALGGNHGATFTAGIASLFVKHK